MALYADCAVVAEVERLCAGYPIAGVTTNPTLLLAARENAGQRMTDIEVLRALLANTPLPAIFMQPAGMTADELRAQSEAYLEQDVHRVTLKLPMSEGGMAAALAIRREQPNTRIAFTAVCSPAQAYAGLAANAEWVIPYFGRLRRAGLDACQHVANIARLLAGQEHTRLLVASLKSPDDSVEVLLAGADDITAPPEVIRALVVNPLSEAAIAQFNADAARLRDLG